MDAPDAPFFDPPFFQRLFDASSDLIFFKDAAGIYRLVNQAVENDLGLPREAILGHTDAELFDSENAKNHERTDRQVVSAGKPAVFDYVFTHSGRSIWLEILKSPVLGPDGSLLGLFCTARNVTTSKVAEAAGRHVRDVLEQQVTERTTSLRQANERLTNEISQRQQAERELADSVRTLNLILDNSPIGIAFVVNRVNQWANPRFHELFGMAEGTIAGKSTLVFYPDQDSYETFGQRHYPQLAKGERVDVVWTMRRADGTDFFCRVIGQLLYPDRPQAGSIWLMEDVTESRRAEEAMLAAERLKREFMGTMSHELLTPLNGILGMAAIIAGSTLTDEQREDVATLQEAAQTLKTLLDNLLDFSRLDAGTPSEPTLFAPRAVLEGVLHSFSGLAQHKHLDLAEAFRPDVPKLLVGDAEGLRRILAALVSNGVKFTERGAVTVTVTSQPASDAESAPVVNLTFAVADTGIGLPQKQRNAIFEPFRQVDGSLTRRFGGTGLGLAIARRTAEAMGGHITVESELGQGSVFRFTAPFALPRDDDAPPR